MRPLIAALTVLSVMALGYWAYMENFRTHQALRELERLNRSTDRQEDRLAMLRAEWAYLNRPDRLRDLVEINFDRLPLMSMVPEHFGEVEQVAYPPLRLPELVDVNGTLTMRVPGRAPVQEGN